MMVTAGGEEAMREIVFIFIEWYDISHHWWKGCTASVLGGLMEFWFIAPVVIEAGDRCTRMRVVY
jgi:hypothetical protein